MLAAMLVGDGGRNEPKLGGISPGPGAAETNTGGTGIVMAHVR